MHRKASHHMRLVLTGLTFALVFGLILGEPAWILILFLGCYLAYSLLQSFRLHQWLYQPDVTPPPAGSGLWGDIFDGIHRLQKEHYKSRNRLQAMINRIQESTNALKDAVVMTDSLGAMDWWNESAENLLGFRHPTDRGQLIYNLVRTPIFKRYFSSKKYQEPLLINAPNNPNIKLQVQITLFGEDDRLIMVQDVTRLFRLEEMRRDFVSNVSHELRTPLTVITGFLETLIDNADSLPARWRCPLMQMGQQSQRMEALINDLLLLSKIENDGQNFVQTEVDIHQILHTICHDAKTLNPEKQHQFTLDIDSKAHLKGNTTQLQSAFSNVLLNAMKYTPAKGEIKVRWFEDTRGAHFSVSDSGIGIAPHHIPRLTERFYRADPSRASETGGTGLGLAIVKHVLINHEGELEIQSRIGDGSIFICHFPQRRIIQSKSLGQRLTPSNLVDKDSL